MGDLGFQKMKEEGGLGQRVVIRGEGRDRSGGRMEAARRRAVVRRALLEERANVLTQTREPNQRWAVLRVTILPWIILHLQLETVLDFHSELVELAVVEKVAEWAGLAVLEWELEHC